MINDYFVDRWLKSDLRQERRLSLELKKIEQRYGVLKKNAVADFKYWYNRLREAEEIDPDALNSSLSKSEEMEWRAELGRIRSDTLETGIAARVPKSFYSLKLDRLDHGIKVIEKNLFELARIDEEQLTDILKQELVEGYKKATYEIKSLNGDINAFKVDTNFRQMDDIELDSIIREDWKGSNFSERIWKNDTEVLPEKLKKSLDEGFQSGEGLDQMVERIEDRFDVAKNRAVTLVQTEAKNIKMKSEIVAMNENGIKEYMYLATLETHTCGECADLDSQIFYVKDAVQGANLPPIHPNCRCTIIPYVEGGLFLTNTRWSRDPRTGKSVRIARVSYNDWWVAVAKAGNAG